MQSGTNPWCESGAIRRNRRTWGERGSRRAVGASSASQDASMMSRVGWQGLTFDPSHCSAEWHGPRGARRFRRMRAATWPPQACGGYPHRDSACELAVLGAGHLVKSFERWGRARSGSILPKAAKVCEPVAEEMATRRGLRQAHLRRRRADEKSGACGGLLSPVPDSQRGEGLRLAWVGGAAECVAGVPDGYACDVSPVHCYLRTLLWPYSF